MDQDQFKESGCLDFDKAKFKQTFCVNPQESQTA